MKIKLRMIVNVIVILIVIVNVSGIMIDNICSTCRVYMVLNIYVDKYV